MNAAVSARLMTAVLVLLSMLATVGVATVITPKQQIRSPGNRVNLEIDIPKQFAQWQFDASLVPIQPSPDAQALLDSLYSQTLARTYVHQDGRRVMLSIAYGDDQTGRLRVHRPDVCYSAQGFQVFEPIRTVLSVGTRKLPIIRARAEHLQRIEPMTYWMVVGSAIAQSSIDQRLIQLRYGLVGEIPDGMIIRVSSIGSDTEKEFRAQDEFISDLIAHVSESTRRHLLGGV